MWSALLIFVCVTLINLLPARGVDDQAELEKLYASDGNFDSTQQGDGDRGTTTATVFDDQSLEENTAVAQAMPDRDEIRCDACTVIAQRLIANLYLAEHLKGRPLKEYHVDTTLDFVCKEGLGDYASKGTRGRERLAGPGAANDQQGVVIGGGVWDRRMLLACRNVVDAIGDEQIYEKVKTNLPKPKSIRIDVAGSAESVEQLVQAWCLMKEDKKSSKKGKKQKKEIFPSDREFLSEGRWKGQANASLHRERMGTNCRESSRNAAHAGALR